MKETGEGRGREEEGKGRGSGRSIVYISPGDSSDFAFKREE